MKHLLLCSFSVLALALSGCESQTIQGRVVDLFGQPIEGVTVAVANSGFSTTTDGDGEYHLDYAPSEKIMVTYSHADKSTFVYDATAKTVSISEKCRYPMPDVELCYVPTDTNGDLWLMQDGSVSELPRTSIDAFKEPIKGLFTKIKREASIVFCFDRNRGKDELCYPMLLSVSEKTGRLVLDFSTPLFPFKSYVYSDVTYVGALLTVAHLERNDQLPKGRYVLCLLDVKRGKVAGTYHGVEIE